MRKLIIISFLSISLWIITLLWSTFANSDFSCSNQIEVFSNLLYNDLWKDNLYNNRYLIKNFCEKAQSLWSCQENWALYSPKQSLFLALLCKTFVNPINDKELILNAKFTAADWYLKIDGRTELNLNQYFYKYQSVASDQDYCSPKTDLNLCEIWRQFWNLFDSILGDYFSIKQANAYGVQDLQTSNIDIVNDFTSWYFMQTKVCDEWVTYYKKTCNTLQNIVKNAKKLLTKTTIIDVQKLKETNSKCNDKYSEDYDLLYCGLLEDRFWGSDDFQNLIYNELLWYRLFIIYYNDTITTDVSRYMPGIYRSMNVNDKNAVMKDRLELMLNYYDRSSLAVDKTNKIINDLYRTFPIHVGFLMYQEDLKSLINAYAKFGAPFITLYDKLRNVQDQDS